jgi:hypothetical protein
MNKNPAQFGHIHSWKSLYLPQTQGKDEWFHHALKSEVFAHEVFADQFATQDHFNIRREVSTIPSPIYRIATAY